MPAVSKKQQKFFGIVRAIQKGEMAPTTPETAKAAADMKKGDVKKFASTKHKGLPEKKKIEEDRQINKIIKQLRKSVKSHKKQADTLEKKVKTFKESNFSNITVGNKVGQTFQHTSGATITLDGALGGKMMVPSQVTIEIPGEFGEGGFPVTVDGPSESDFGLAGFTKPLDIKLQKRIADQSVAQINDRLDASRGLSGAETARVSGIPSRQDGFGGGQGNRTNRRGSAFNKDGSVNLGAKGDMTYKDVTDALNAIADKYNKKRDPLYAAIRERRAGTEAADKIDAYNRASEKEEKAVYDAWDEFNKQQNPDLNLPQDIPDSPENPGLPDAKSDADAKAGYEKARKGNPDLPSWDELSSDLKLPDIPKEGWTYLEYMAMYDALGDAAARLLDPIVKEKLRYGPTGFEGVFKTYTDQYGQRNTPIGLIDAESAIIDALTRAQGALTAAWEAYNKAGLPPEGGGGIETTPVPDASNPYGTPPGGLDDEDNEDEDKDNEDEDKDDEEKDDEEKKDKDKKKKDKKDDTSELGDTQGEFMPSNPQGMRQQGVGKSANDLGRHSPGTSAQQPKTKGGQGGRRLGSTTSRQGGAYGPRNPYGSGTVNTNTPTGLGRVFGGAVDALTGGLTDFDNRGGKPTGLSRVLAGTVDAITGQKTDLDQRGSYLQAIMKAGTKLPKVDKYQSGVNTAIRYDRFLHKMGKNNSSPSVKGSTPDNRIDITNEISKKDKNYVETELNKEAERTSKDKVLTFNNSLEALSKSDTTESDINDAKKTVQDIFAKAYLDKAGLVATFGGTGDPKTGENPALPEVLDVRDRGNYYEVDFGKSYAFREGGSEPDVKGLQARFLKAIKAEPDTIGSDTISSVVAPVFAKLAITGDDKYFRKKNGNRCIKSNF